jgi:hypothetical protein
MVRPVLRVVLDDENGCFSPEWTVADSLDQLAEGEVIAAILFSRSHHLDRVVDRLNQETSSICFQARLSDPRCLAAVEPEVVHAALKGL